MRKINVTVSKTSTVSSLCEKIAEQVEEDVDKDDLCIADVWSDEVYTFFSPTDEVSRIRDSDQSYAFQLTPVPQLHSDEQTGEQECFRGTTMFFLSSGGLVDQLEHADEEMDAATKLKLSNKDKWISVLEKYTKNATYLSALLNIKRTSHEERMAFLDKLQKFVQQCSACPESTPIDSIDDDNIDNSQLTLAETSAQSTTFRNIESREDLLVLNYCGRLFYEHTMKLYHDGREKLKNGIIVQILFKKEISRMEKIFASPLVMRISPRLTVYGLRKMLGQRLKRVLGNMSPTQLDATHKHDLAAVVGMSEDSFNDDDVTKVSNEDIEEALITDKPNDISSAINSNHDPLNRLEMVYPINETVETLIMRRVPMTFSRKNNYTYSSTHTTSQLGSLHKPSYGGCEYTLASPTHDTERELVSELVGNLGTISLHWSPTLAEECFNSSEWDTLEDDIAITGSKSTKNKKRKTITVLDCIEKYCQEEQLEESEMWYCNRCKAHVRAWKQFHLYRTPPILIVHLKRFHYSSTTHRRDKIDAFIDFPLDNLDLRPFVMSWADGQEPVYDCYAVSNHYGGLGGGHYTAYAKNNGLWCHFDDSRVTEGVDEQDVVSSAAYVLYYRRRDVANLDWNTNASNEQQPTTSSCISNNSSAFSISSSSSSPSSPAVSSMSCNYDGNNNNIKVDKMIVSTTVDVDSPRTCNSPLDSIDGEEMYTDDIETNDDEYVVRDEEDDENPQGSYM